MNTPSEHDVARCLAILAVAKKHPGITLDALAKKTHITRAELERDLLETLVFCGVPPYFPHQYVAVSLDGDRVTVAFADQFDRPVSLTPFEALALKVAVESLVAPGAAPPPVMRSLVDKVEAGMAPAARDAFRKLADSVDAGAGGASSLARRIVAAAVGKNVVEIDYLKPGIGLSTRRVVEPYAVLEHGGAWYVAARDPKANAVKAFRLDRILAATVLPQRFRPASKWSPDAFLGAMSRRAMESTGPKSKIRFYGAGVRWIVENAPPGTVKRTGASVVWTTPFEDAKGFAAFLLGSGVPFEVLEPKALVREVRATATAVARLHDGKSPPTPQ